jgi:hypothetical protein
MGNVTSILHATSLAVTLGPGSRWVYRPATLGGTAVTAF